MKKLDRANLVLQIVSVVGIVLLFYVCSMRMIFVVDIGENKKACALSSEMYTMPTITCMSVPEGLEKITLYTK